MRGDASARERFLALPDDAERETWFEAVHRAIVEGYLAEPRDPFRESGRSSGAVGWAPKRRCIADAVHRDGHLLDVGCANGLLLESLIGWCSERGLRLVPHGVDFAWELVALARARHPAFAANFEVANALWWTPPRRYDFVRTNVEYVQHRDRAAAVRRLWEDAVARGGRLILCHYASDGEPVDVAGLLEAEGLAVAGTSGAERVAVAWTDGPRGPGAGDGADP